MKGLRVEPGERTAVVMSTKPSLSVLSRPEEPTEARISPVSMSAATMATETRGSIRRARAAARRSSASWNGRSTVSAISRAAGWARTADSARCAASMGKARRAVGIGSCLAAAASSSGRAPRATRRSSTTSRLRWAAAGSRSGRRASGDCGRATSNAASAVVRRVGSLPNQARLAARTPSMLPP